MNISMHRIALLLLPLLLATAADEWVPAKMRADGTYSEGHWRTVRDPAVQPTFTPPAYKQPTFTPPSYTKPDYRTPSNYTPAASSAAPSQPRQPSTSVDSTWVEGHYRKDGTWVDGHYRKSRAK